MAPSNDSRGSAPSAGGTRHAVRARALVAGLAPAVVPMIISEIGGTVVTLNFEGPVTAIDERWATLDTGLLIIFKGMVDGEPRRSSALGRLRMRDASGIEVTLVGLDADTKDALKSLITQRKAGTGGAAARAVSPGMTRDALGALCSACVREHAPATVKAFLDALALALRSAETAAGSAAELKRATNMLAELERSRADIERQTLGRIVSSVATFMEEDEGGSSPSLAGGLSLIESVDLRATFAINDAIQKIAARVRVPWLDLEQRLARIVPHRGDANPLAPLVLCHVYRDAIFYDDRLGALHQVDFTRGFSDTFVTYLEHLYRETSEMLERNGVEAGVARGGRSSGRER